MKWGFVVWLVWEVSFWFGYHGFFDYEKGIFVGTWKNFGVKWFEIFVFCSGIPEIY